MLGAHVKIERGVRPDFTLFGEDQSRIIISVSPGSLTRIDSILARFEIESSVLGTVGGTELAIEGLIRLPLRKIGEIYGGALEKKLGIEAVIA